MTRRSFRGEAGRPFGTVAAMICLLLTIAVIVLGRIAAQITGASSPIDVAPERLAMMHDYWGLLLAGEIVKVVTGAAVLLAIWTLARPVGPSTGRSRAALALGSLGAAMLILASRQGIVAAAHLNEMVVIPYGEAVALLGRLGIACLGLWAALLALEARRAASLPRWVRDAGFALCAASLAALLLPALVPLAAAISLVWWAGLFATLYRPEDRLSA